MVPNAGIGEPVRFTKCSVSLDGSVDHVLWDFGKSVPDTTFETVRSYRRMGTFGVTVVVWDTRGRGAVQENSIRIDATNPRQ